MDDELLKVDFGDGVSAVDRVQRAVVMLTGQAQSHLESLGYERDTHIKIEVHEDGLPVWLSLRGKQVYEIGFEMTVEGAPAVPIRIRGHWLKKVKKRGFFSRIWR